MTVGLYIYPFLPVEEYLLRFKFLAIVNDHICYEHTYISISMKLFAFFGVCNLKWNVWVIW